MKKNLKIATSVFLVIAMCMSLFLAGCKNNSDDASAESEYAALAGVYISKITMSETQSVDLYLQISEDGSFIFARDTEFSSNEKGAGTLGKTEDDKDAFFYTVVNGEDVAEGERVATYELKDDGSIQFTSPMWFGSTEPKIVAEDESVSYPCFEKYADAPQAKDDVSAVSADDEESTQATTGEDEQSSDKPSKGESSTTKAASVSAENTTAKPQSQNTTANPAAATTAKATTAKTTAAATQPALSGTYTGSMSKYVDAMSSTAKYNVTVTFNNGNYDYRVKITISGEMEYSDEEHYTGTYTVNGNSISMTGELSSGTINGSSVTINGRLSSFAGQNEKLTVFK